MILNWLNQTLCSSLLLFSVQLKAESQGVLEVTSSSYPDPAQSRGHLLLRNHSPDDVTCTIKVKGIIAGQLNGKEVKARQEAEPVVGIKIKAGRETDLDFDFSRAVNRMRNLWGDPNAILSEVDDASFTYDCQKNQESSSPALESLYASIGESGIAISAHQRLIQGNQRPEIKILLLTEYGGPGHLSLAEAITLYPDGSMRSEGRGGIFDFKSGSAAYDNKREDIRDLLNEALQGDKAQSDSTVRQLIEGILRFLG